MPRKTLFRSDFFPYHVTARTNNKEPFPVSLDVVWEIITSECFSMSVRFGSEVHALVLMPNHFHLLLTTPEQDLGVVMHTFMKNITMRVNAKSGKIGHLFGGPYHWSIINHAQYYYHALKYVYRNPIKAGLVDQVENYRFSSYSGLLGHGPLHLPIHYTRAGLEFTLPGQHPIDWLKWLNQPFGSEAESVIRAALRKRIHSVPIELLMPK